MTILLQFQPPCTSFQCVLGLIIPIVSLPATYLTSETRLKTRGDRAFAVRTPELAGEIRSSESMISFKSLIKTYFTSESHPSINFSSSELRGLELIQSVIREPFLIFFFYFIVQFVLSFILLFLCIACLVVSALISTGKLLYKKIFITTPILKKLAHSMRYK